MNTFCDSSKIGMSRGVDDTIWDLVIGFMQYDSIAALAAVPSLRSRFFRPMPVLGSLDTVHLVIGTSELLHGISDPSELLAFLCDGYRRGLSLSHCRKLSLVE